MNVESSQNLENFRPMVENDLENVLYIENTVYDFPWSQTIFFDCLQVEHSCWVLLNKKADIDAYGVMSVNSEEGHILNLCVHPQAQGMGIGKNFLHYFLGIAKQAKVDTVFLEVRPSNNVARLLYANSGFNEIGLRRDYYPARNGREDAIIMAYALQDCN